MTRNLTTIKVPVDLRDQLKDAAAREGRTISSMIELLLERELNRVQFARLRKQIANTPPESMREYEEEHEVHQHDLLDELPAEDFSDVPGYPG